MDIVSSSHLIDGLASIGYLRSNTNLFRTSRYNVHTGRNEFCGDGYTEDLGSAVPGEATGSIDLWDGRKSAELWSLLQKEDGNLEGSKAIEVGLLIVL